MAAPTVCCLQVDCAVGAWSRWSKCAAATGRKERTRFIVTRPSSDGNACPALDDATDCIAGLHDAADENDLAAVKARSGTPSVTGGPGREMPCLPCLQSLLAAGAAVNGKSSAG